MTPSTDDYEALRHGVGVVTLARDVVALVGPDAVDYLQGQCSQDIAALAPGASADALLLTPQGKLDALIRVTRVGDEEVYVDVESGYGPAVMARLNRFKLRVKAEITALAWTGLALRGPHSGRVVNASSAVSGAAVAVAFEWNGVVGTDLLGPGPEVSSEVRRCGAEAWQSVRVEAGIPVMGAELDERTIAAEADLLDRCVSFTKGCYTGQELVARLDARGNKVARRLRGLVAAHPDPGVSGFEPGAEVVAGEKVVGRITSVAWSPALGSMVALAYLHRDVEPPCPVTVRQAQGTSGAAEARVLPLVD